MWAGRLVGEVREGMLVSSFVQFCFGQYDFQSARLVYVGERDSTKTQNRR